MRAVLGTGMVVAAVAASALAVPASSTATSGSSGPIVIGLGGEGKKLVTFRTAKSSKVSAPRTITGLTGDTSLIGIDYRVQTGLLYGVGNQGGIYSISGAAAKKVSQLSVALEGTSFGVDFNPAANRLRIVSNTGQNLRHNIDDGATAGTTLVDTPLTTPPATTTTTGITAAAYTNNDLDASTGTTLFDLDTTLDQFSIQSPANNGLLAATGMTGVDADTDAGLDIYSSVTNGRTVSSRGFAVLSVNGKSAFYTVSLLNGAVAKVRSLPNGITDLAIGLDKS